ncbi:hypothetical protein N9493_09360, partial [Amylibacter sp.]|nr:hypothetical protein [Amylibacter sp.]
PAALDVKLTWAKPALALSASVVAMAVLDIALSIVSSISFKLRDGTIATPVQAISRWQNELQFSYHIKFQP